MSDGKDKTRRRLTTKQLNFVEEYVKQKEKGANHPANEAAKLTYKTEHPSVIAHQNMNSKTVQRALQNLFPVDRTKLVVDELFDMTQEANDKLKLEAIKTWTGLAIPKQNESQNVQYNQIQINQKEKYDL